MSANVHYDSTARSFLPYGEYTLAQPDPSPAISCDIRVAIDAVTFAEIRELRKREYRDVYPDMDLDNDELDLQAITLYSRNADGEINSTARLSVDGPCPLPEQDYLESYRADGKRLMEWGRFIIVGGNRKLLKNYYRAVHTIASRLGYDVIVMAMQPGHLSLHSSLLGLRILKEKTGVTYGGPHDLSCVAWELENTQPGFFKWINK